MTYVMRLRAREEVPCDKCGKEIMPGWFYAAGVQNGRVVRHHSLCAEANEVPDLAS
jgi:hypothetical protein